MRAGSQPAPTQTLDSLYFNNDKQLLNECLNLFKTRGNTQYTLSTKGAAERIIDDIINNVQQPINQGLYEQYAANLRKAINSVYSLEGDDGLADQFRANVSRFAAYKAFHATQQVKQQLESSSLEDAKKVIHTFNRYQAAEYNTAVGRCRTAKQFAEFAEKDNLRLFPNLRWLPSRSVKLREEHIPFYDRIWAKTDPFWANNQPGNLWNCKCDWEQTDDPTTDGNPTTNIRHNGLEGNPAITGEIFTDNASYIKQSPQITLDKQTNQAFKNLQALLSNDNKQWRVDYYTDNEGMLLTSRKWTEGGLNKQQRAKFNKEYSTCRTLVLNKHKVEYRADTPSSFDIYLDGIAADIKNTKGSGNIVSYAKKAIKKQGAKLVVFEFKNETKETYIELKKLKKIGIKGYYFFRHNKNKIYEL